MVSAISYKKDTYRLVSQFSSQCDIMALVPSAVMAKLIKYVSVVRLSVLIVPTWMLSVANLVVSVSSLVVVDDSDTTFFVVLQPISPNRANRHIQIVINFFIGLLLDVFVLFGSVKAWARLGCKVSVSVDHGVRVTVL